MGTAAAAATASADLSCVRLISALPLCVLHVQMPVHCSIAVLLYANVVINVGIVVRFVFGHGSNDCDSHHHFLNVLILLCCRCKGKEVKGTTRDTANLIETDIVINSFYFFT